MISKALMVGAYHAKLRELSRLGVELTVVVPQRWLGKEREQVQPHGYDLLVMNCALNRVPHFHFYPAIEDAVRRRAWDLVHIDEEPYTLVAYHALRACLRAGRKAIFFTWQNISKKYPLPFAYFERFTHNHTEAAIAGSEEICDILQKRKFSKPIAVIPQFGVDLEFFRKSDASGLREKLGLAGKFSIGYVGRIVKEKGIADLIHALATLPELCVLVLVGNGEDELRIKKLAEELGVASRIRWIPHISSLEVPQYMNALDVLVLPSRTTSRWKEQFGRVLIEAMACETPVIGSDSGEIPKVIGDSGLVFPEGDPDALVQGLRLLLEHPDLRREIGAKGCAHVLKNFTHRRIAEQTVGFYSQVVNGFRANRTAVCA